MIKVLINADDYGWTESCSKAIMKAFNDQLIYSTTIMSVGAYFDEAVRIIQNSDSRQRVGIHFDLTEGTPLTEGIKNDPFFCEHGSFHMHINRRIPLTPQQKNHAYEELCAQAQRFKDTGLRFHHADSHHHIHTAPFLIPVFQKVFEEYGINMVRIHRNVGSIPFYKREIKKVYNTQLNRKGLAYSDYFGGFDDARSFNPIDDNSIIEIMCHPDFDINGALIDRNSNAPYDKPYGKELNRLVSEIIEMRLIMET